MPADFIKFHRTTHLTWLVKHPPREDKVIEPSEAKDFLKHRIVVEEKIDGTNVGISLDQSVGLRLQNRGEFLSPGRDAQFGPLWSWIRDHREGLEDALGDDLILFGEWCFAVHTVKYNRLPDWFLGFDIFDRSERFFWSTKMRDRWLVRVGIVGVPELAEGQFSLDQLTHLLVGSSRFGDEPMEGIYLRCNEGQRLRSRAKLVQPQFLEGIQQHWSARKLRKNALTRSHYEGADLRHEERKR